MSTATAITVNRKIAKKKVVRNFLSMYQSSFFIPVTRRCGVFFVQCQKYIKTCCDVVITLYAL